MKTSELLREIAAAGGVVIRQRGSHRIFRLPDGTRLTIPVSGAHVDASTGTIQRARKALAGIPSVHLRTRTLR